MPLPLVSPLTDISDIVFSTVQADLVADAPVAPTAVAPPQCRRRCGCWWRRRRRRVWRRMLEVRWWRHRRSRSQKPQVDPQVELAPRCRSRWQRGVGVGSRWHPRCRSRWHPRWRSRILKSSWPLDVGDLDVGVAGTSMPPAPRTPKGRCRSPRRRRGVLATSPAFAGLRGTTGHLDQQHADRNLELQSLALVVSARVHAAGEGPRRRPRSSRRRRSLGHAAEPDGGRCTCKILSCRRSPCA